MASHSDVIHNFFNKTGKAKNGETLPAPMAIVQTIKSVYS